MQGTISYLRSLGFDMFDDIIDHSYDEIQDHYVRMMMAIKNNRKILEDRQLAIDSWYSCSTRFEKNYSLIVKMYKSTETTAKIKILESIN